MNTKLPSDRGFTSEHEWAKHEGAQALIGITDHAQHCLGDVVYVELPQEGQAITKGAAIGVVESVKAVSDIYAPISGIVRAVNKEVIETPELLNQDPYGRAWLLKIEIREPKELSELLNAHDYALLLEQEAKTP